MNDKELADAVVALGVGRKPDCAHPDFELWYLGLQSFEADEFVRDWRVAGASLEAAKHPDYIMDRAFEKTGSLIPEESLPRAITEACVEALK